MEVKYIRDSLYTISEDGTVTSHKGKTINTWKENNSGYHLVRVRYSDQSNKCFRLHRVLAEAFLPNPEGHTYVKHKDDDKDNNILSNLEWGTNAENTQEGYDNSCYTFKRRSYKVFATCHNTGEVFEFKSLRSLAKGLKLHRKNVAAILKGIKNNTYPYDFKYSEENV